MNGAVLRMIAHSPPLLPCAFPYFNYNVVCLFNVVQSMLIVVVCRLFPIRERNECKIDACVKPEIQTGMRLTLFVSACVLFGLLSDKIN